MDIEKLIVSLRSPSWQDLEDPDAPLLEDAAHALSTLQAENEKLRTELKKAEMELDSLLAEGETVAFDPFGAEKED